MDIQWKKEWTAPAISGAVSFAAGVGVGFLISRRALDHRIEEGIRRVQDAVDHDAAKRHDAMRKLAQKSIRRVEVVEPWSELQEEAERSLRDYRGGPRTLKATLPAKEEEIVEQLEELAVDTVSVWFDDWNVDEELAERTVDAPYILHLNEYVNNEKGYHQQQLRWYTEDSTLVDENNVVVHRPEQILGHLNFGHGSKDPDTVYIRNDKRRGEYEVVRIEGSFMQMIMGAHAEQQAAEEDLKHSNTIRRFRPDRD